MEKKASSNKYYETILDWFKSQIMSGELKEGDTIPSERELATRFGVSRVPVMTVQKVDIQLLNPKANFATDITMETIENLFEVRIFLESAAAYYAAKRRTDEDIRLMHESIHQMLEAIDSQSKDDEAIIKASHDFHFHVIEAAKNPVLSNMYRNLYDLLEISKQYTMKPTEVSDATVMDHEAILYKIESGNADEASRYMKFHLSRAMRKLNPEEE